ncbi:MAG: tRNA threonylcarbamoyladenosine dehydratase [Kiritimatiellia bacterium]
MPNVDLSQTNSDSLWYSGSERLYGKEGFRRLRAARVCVVGIGGVGSWTAEALARAGIGQISLVDMDEICSSNLNRQLHATLGTVGRSKVEVMKERILQISPGTVVEDHFVFFTEKTCGNLLENPPDVIVDCIDSIPHKCLLLSECRNRQIPAVTVGAAGGRADPSRVQLADLSRTFDDALLQRVRKKLRQKHGFPRNTRKKWGVPAVFSPEPVRYPQSDGSVCGEREPESRLRLDCASGYGTAGFVTGTFGFCAAAAAVNLLLEKEPTAVDS